MAKALGPFSHRAHIALLISRYICLAYQTIRNEILFTVCGRITFIFSIANTVPRPFSHPRGDETGMALYCMISMRALSLPRILRDLLFGHGATSQPLSSAAQFATDTCSSGLLHACNRPELYICPQAIHAFVPGHTQNAISYVARI